MSLVTPEAIEAFKKHVFQKDHTVCWPWNGKNSKTFGRVLVNGKYHCPAHRFSYEFHCHPIPPGMVVIHTCKNPSCVNPLHLKLQLSGKKLAISKAADSVRYYQKRREDDERWQAELARSASRGMLFRLNKSINNQDNGLTD